MNPASRSRSGAAVVVDRGVKKGGTRVDDAGSCRPHLAQMVAGQGAAVNLKHQASSEGRPATRSRSGQPRDLDGKFIKAGSMAEASGPVQDLQQSVMADQEVDHVGRFIKGGSKVVVSTPVQAKQQVAAPVQVGACGSKNGAAVSGQSPQVQAAAELAEDDDSDHQASSDKIEVSSFDSEGNDHVSSSAKSGSDAEFDKEEEEELEEVRNTCPVLLNADCGQMADQVFDHMPHTCPTGPRDKLGAANKLIDQVGSVGAAKGAPWANLFKDNRNLGNGILLDEWEVEGDLVTLEEDDVDVVEEAWGYCLVGLFAGKFPGMAAVRKLKEGWKVECTLWRHRSGWFVFKFQSEEDRRAVLNGGPYFVFGTNLILKILPRCFRFEGEDVSSVPIWIQLPGLPLDCWNARSLGKIVSKVGKPITTDKLTLTKERLSFARVLVEVDASTEIVKEVEVRLPTGEMYQQLVIPEFIPKYCNMCRSFGHMVGDCGIGSRGSKFSCGKGLDERQHRAYVPKKKSLPDTPAVAVQVGTCLQGHVPADQTREKIQAWLMSGPKVVQNAAEPKVGPVPKGTRVKEVLSAFATALGVTVEISGAPSSEDLRDGCAGVGVDRQFSGAEISAEGRSVSCRPTPVGAGLLPVDSGLVAAPPSASGCPVEDLGAVSLGGPGAGKKKKKKKKSGQYDGAAVQIQSEGVEECVVDRHATSISVLKGIAKGKAPQSSN